MRGKRFIVAMVVVLMTILAGCSSKSTTEQSATGTKKQGGTFIIAVGSDPNILNPMYGNDRTTMTINNSLFSPLFVEDGDKLKYYLAESFTPSADFMTYTLKLKKNLKWHDGKPITADDMVFTMDKIMDQKQSIFLRDGFVIDGKEVKYKKVDDLTIEYKLPKVSMAFTAAVAQVSPIPKHVFEGEADIAKSSKNETPIGSGPFKYKEAKKGETVTLVRNDDYIGGKPNFDSVVYRVLPDANASNTALQNGEISVKYLDPKDVERFKKEAKFNVVTYNEGMLNHLILNQNNDNLKKLDVRQAIAYAINKKDIIKAAYISSDLAEEANSILTPDALYYTPEVNKLEQNVAKSKELLSKAGVSNLKLKLGYIKGSQNQEPTALIIQQNLKDIGIDVTLVPMEKGAFYQKIMSPKDNKDLDLALNGYVMGKEPDIYKPLFTVNGSGNYENYANPSIDEIWNKAVTETDKTKRAELYKDIQKKLADEVAIYPIAYPKSIIAMDKKIGGVTEAEPISIFMFRDLSKLYFTE